VRVHIGLIVCLLICIPAFIFEVSRAIGGNTLSWAYVFEWPILATFGVYMWWRLLHGDQPSQRKSSPDSAMNADDADRLKAWNAYLKELHADGGNTPD
jgi:hypothetical protein